MFKFFKYGILDIVIFQGLIYFFIYFLIRFEPWRKNFVIEESFVGKWDYVSFFDNENLEVGNANNELFLFSIKNKKLIKTSISQKGSFVMFENIIEENVKKKIVFDFKKDKINIINKKNNQVLFTFKNFSCAPIASFSPQGDRLWVEGPLHSILVYENFFPEQWWGIFFRIEFWGIFIFLILGGLRIISRFTKWKRARKKPTM